MKKLGLGILFAGVIFFAACTTSVNQYAKDTYPPTSPNDVVVYKTIAPDRAYIEIGDISAANISKIKKEAAKLGADAVIITGSELNEWYQKEITKAVAIKFKQI